jgi:hypothetical protein
MITVIDIIPDLRAECLPGSAANLALNETNEIMHVFRFERVPNHLILSELVA